MYTPGVPADFVALSGAILIGVAFYGMESIILQQTIHNSGVTYTMPKAHYEDVTRFRVRAFQRRVYLQPLPHHSGCSHQWIWYFKRILCLVGTPVDESHAPGIPWIEAYGGQVLVHLWTSVGPFRHLMDTQLRPCFS